MADISNDLNVLAKVTAIKTFSSVAIGEAPTAVNRGDHVDIIFSDAAMVKLQQFVYDSLMQKPGKVRIDTYAIAFPPLLKVYGKIAIIALVCTFLLGRITK
jgi:hypothetical protein